jgi:S-DNA-T family DNA segregation ATPase FtsK/SpoIIIE
MVDRKNKNGLTLVALSGPDAGKSYILNEGTNLIGRTPDADVSLSDPSVSRSHAVIRREKDSMTIFELGSTLGTEVDGRLLGGLPISNGDMVTIGKTKLTFATAAV